MKKFVFLFFCIFQFSHAQGLFCLDLLSQLKNKALSLSTQKDQISDPFFAGSEQATSLISTSKTLKSQAQFYAAKDRKHQAFSELKPIVKNMISHLKQAKELLPIWRRTKSNYLLFSAFEKEAIAKIEKNQITFHWLIIFSMRVSLLTDNSFHFDLPLGEKLQAGAWKNHESAAEYFDGTVSLPRLVNGLADKKNISLPFFGDLGLFALNEFTAEGISPLGHNLVKVKVDGVSYSPYLFWAHDAAHSYPYQFQSADFQPYAKNFLKLVQNLTLAERQQAEFFFFYFSHESTLLIYEPKISVEKLTENFKSFMTIKDFTNLVSNCQDINHFGPLLKAAGVDIKQKSEVQNWLHKSFNIFLQIHSNVTGT